MQRKAILPGEVQEEIFLDKKILTLEFRQGDSFTVPYSPEVSLILPALSVDELSFAKEGADLLLVQDCSQIVVSGFFSDFFTEAASVYFADGATFDLKALFQPLPASSSDSQELNPVGCFGNDSHPGYTEFDLSTLSANAAFFLEGIEVHASLALPEVNLTAADTLDGTVLRIVEESGWISASGQDKSPVILDSLEQTADYLSIAGGVVRQGDGFTEVDLSHLFFSTLII